MTARDTLPPRDEFAVLLGRRIQAARWRAGLTQGAVDKSCGFAPTTVSHYEAARRTPCAFNLALIAVALDVSVGLLLGVEI